LIPKNIDELKFIETIEVTSLTRVVERERERESESKR
jgi:hypothetical protein